MRHKLLATVTVAVMLTSTACTSMRFMSKSSGTYQPETTSVSVRFVLPSEQMRYTEFGTQPEMQLAADSTYDGFSSGDQWSDASTMPPGAYHVALWGGPYDGTNVTTYPTKLPPGSYTFAFFDQPDEAVMQGWLEVRNTGSDLISVLNRWRDSVAEQKERLAYDLEIDGRINTGSLEVFESFKRQMDECDRLQRRIEETIVAERRAQDSRQQQVRDLLDNTDIRIMPGEDSFFGPTTEPAFSMDDLDTVRDGEVVTKIVLAADYEEAQWKLDRLNQLYDDLSRFKEVLRQEADRLDRRKGLLLITDHLYDHDKKFVHNEMNLQYTLGVIDRIQSHATDLRERRMALAFIKSLFSPDGDFGALREEEHNLFRERTVLETERVRLNQLFDDTEVSSPRRVALERSRQGVTATIETIDGQIQSIQQAHDVLASMVNSTDVIHRHNDMRLLTTTFVASSLPPAIRRIVEREGVMTVRLETVDKLFAPRPTGVATTGWNNAPAYGSQTSTNNQGWPQQAETRPVTQETDVTWVRHQEEPKNNRHANTQQPKNEVQPVTPVTPVAPVADRAGKTKSSSNDEAHVWHKTTDTKPMHKKPGNKWVHHQEKSTDDPQKTTDSQPVNQKPDNKWVHHQKKSVDHGHVQAQPQKHTVDTASPVANRPCNTKSSPKDEVHAWNTKKGTQPKSEKRFTKVSDSQDEPANYGQNVETNREWEADNNDCPWYLKLLVPPCWIESQRSRVAGQPTSDEPETMLAYDRQEPTYDQPEAKLAYDRQEPTDDEPKAKLANDRQEPTDDEQNEVKKDGCPWYLKLLVPPCWIEEARRSD